MNKKVFLLMAIVLSLALFIGACTRSATGPTAAAPSPSAEAPFPVSTKVTNFATQTAMAAAPKGPTTPAQTAQPAQTGQPAQPAQPTAAGPAVATATKQPAAPVVVPTATNAPAKPQEQPQEEPVSIPTLTRPNTYTLQRGEHPFCIARRFDVDPGTLLSINGLGVNSRPGTGTVLRIPQSGNWSANYGSRALKGHPDTYVVQSGDTIYSIACAYGDVSPEGIIAANRLSGPGDIRSGMSLKIP